MEKVDLKLSRTELAAAWVHFAASAFSAYGVPREYPYQALDTGTAAKRAALAADELMLEFRTRLGEARGPGGFGAFING